MPQILDCEGLPARIHVLFQDEEKENAHQSFAYKCLVGMPEILIPVAYWGVGKD
jgi:hypothetical protein